MRNHFELFSPTAAGLGSNSTHHLAVRAEKICNRIVAAQLHEIGRRRLEVLRPGGVRRVHSRLKTLAI